MAANVEPIVIVDYDDEWPRAFEAERAVVADAVHDWIVGGIEHVGSTAVVGMPAKPVVDILVGVRSLAASRGAIPRLEAIGYGYAPYRADVMHWLCKPSRTVRTHHLYLVPFGSRTWIERLAFRDYLRAHADVAAEYASLKRMLARRHAHDRDAYTDAKASFIARVLRLAAAETQR